MNGDIGHTELKIAILNFKESIETHLEYAKLEAQIKRAKFVALVAEGFTEDQALQLVK